MRWILLNALVLGALHTWAGAAAASPPEESWAVIGLRHRHGPSMHEAVATLRGSLALELSARDGGLVLDDDETRSRLGLGSSSLREIRAKVDAAELYYFQLELGLARDNLERAVAQLAYVAGAADAWERNRVAKILLGMVFLAEGGIGSRTRALEQFESVARLQPELLPSEVVQPPEVVALYREARERVASLPKGKLRVVCESGCPSGQVWVDSQPMGVPGEAIELPKGRYGILLTDRFEKPRAISWLREVEIDGDAETVVVVDLVREAAVRAEEGPSLLLERDKQVEPGAIRAVAERLDVDRLLVVEASGDGFAARVVERSGRIQPLTLPANEKESVDSALARLARLALGEPPESREAVAAVVARGGEGTSDMAPAWVEKAEPLVGENQTKWMGWGKWSAAGAAVVAAGIGTALKLDADKREANLARHWDGWGRLYPSEALANRSRQEAEAIQRNSDWGTGFLVSAGVGAAAAVTLFWLDAGREPITPSIEW